MVNKTIHTSFLLFTLLLITVTGCKNAELVRQGDSMNVAFDKSMALFEKGAYSDAAYGFDLVTRMGRGTDYAKEAQYYLAESYFIENKFILASAEYERFISYYPQDPKREEIEYKRAMCYYHQSPRYRLDQSATYRAIELFQIYNTRYPDSEYVVESAERINELRAKLAHKSFESAEFYLRIKSYKAASIYYDQTIDQFPESIWAERSLVKQIETYVIYADNSVPEKQAERYEMAIETYEKFLQLFPESDLRGDADKLYTEAVKKLADVDVPASGDDIGSNN